MGSKWNMPPGVSTDMIPGNERHASKVRSAKMRVLEKFPGASLWTEAGWYWVLLTHKDSAPGSHRNERDAWADAARRANV